MDCFVAALLAMTGKLSTHLFGTIGAGLSHNATRWMSRFKLWNGCGTNRARIGDSLQLLLRSPQHPALALRRRTRSSLRGSDKRRFWIEFLKGCEGAESNQKRERVNRIHATIVVMANAGTHTA